MLLPFDFCLKYLNTSSVKYWITAHNNFSSMCNRFSNIAINMYIVPYVNISYKDTAYLPHILLLAIMQRTIKLFDLKPMFLNLFVITFLCRPAVMFDFSIVL